MNWFESIYSDDLPSRAVAVYMDLVHRTNSDGQCWPSERTIARDLSISKSTVKRALNDLKRSGYLTVEQRHRKSGANSTLLYTVKDFKKYINTKG